MAKKINFPKPTGPKAFSDVDLADVVEVIKRIGKIITDLAKPKSNSKK